MFAAALFAMPPEGFSEEEPEYVLQLRQLEIEDLERIRACISALRERRLRKALLSISALRSVRGERPDC